MIIAREIKVRGRVQGVNFRHYTREEALKRGIRGTIENADDGSVIICAEGEEGEMRLFLEWCRKGPSRAIIESIEVRESVPKGYQDFVIRRKFF